MLFKFCTCLFVITLLYYTQLTLTFYAVFGYRINQFTVNNGQPKEYDNTRYEMIGNIEVI